ncbi:MAG: metallophosphoesterase [Clostridia bacterium]|nr:metallophosphoesterase [Clostridia bacterium]
MKILVLSDTHGKLDKVYRVFEKLNNIDLIIHCGDYIRDAHTLEDTLGIPVVAVKGNCDGCCSLSKGESYDIVDTPVGNILVTHGHIDSVDFDLSRLMYRAEENDCECVCFGHTHVAVCEDMDGILMVNPGSLSLPRDGSSGSYAIIHSDDDGFLANIVYYDMVFPDNKKKKVQGGFVRGLLNYSDRF